MLTNSVRDEWFFHYTTAHGLQGILQSASFWATDANYLNDYREVQTGIGYARAWLNANREELTERCGLAVVKRIELNMGTNVGHQSGPQMFVCSLTELGDSLSQWRAYGGDGGYAIGIHGSHLRKKAAELGLVFRKCLYDHDESANPVSDSLSSLLRGTFFEKLAEEEKAKLGSDNLFQMCGLIMRESIVLKGKAFEEEKEWRLFPDIAFGQTHQFMEEFRIRASVFVPFTKLPLFPIDEAEKYLKTSSNSAMPVLKLVIGPTNHKDLARVGLSKMLRQLQKQYHFMGPQHSAASFRNL